jgi:hypothetical protein
MASSTAGHLARIKVSGDATAFTAEATTTADDQTYTIANAAKSVWDRSSAITVLIGGTPASPTGADPFSINRLTGQVIFDDDDAGRGAVTVTGDYLPLTVAAKVKSFSYELSSPPIDDTTFDSDGWMESLPNMIGLSGTLGRNVQATGTYFFDAIADGVAVLLEFFENRNSARVLRCWAFIMKDGANASTDSVVSAEVEFHATQDVDGNVAAVA